MKNFIIFFICACLLSACQEKPEKIQISGTVSNNTNDYALFAKDSTGIGLSTVIDTIKIDGNGDFSFESNILKSDGLFLFNGQKPLRLLIPKELTTSIKIDLNLLEPDSIKIIGKQADFTKYYIDQQKYWIKTEKNMSDKHSVLATRNTADIDYYLIQDSITDLRISYLEKYFANSNIQSQEKFITSQKSSLIYSNLYYRMSGKKPDIVKKLKFYGKSDEILTYSDKVNLLDKNLFANREYVNFINDAIMSIVRYENPYSDLSSYELYLNKGFEAIDKLYKNSETNQLQKIVFVNHLISSAKIFKASININKFQKVINSLKNQETQNNLEIVENQLKQVENSMSKFAIGKIAPDFELENVDGEKHKSSDFANKIIFIDVWASWCGPCISSFPKWNKLIEGNSNEDKLAFLTVSLDSDRSKWDNALDKLNLNGLKLYAGTEAFDSHFAKSFEIKSLPSYIAIDDKGKILLVSSSINEFEEIIKNKLAEK
ncbi:TlpA disulfide reductase family protein [Polaribacter sp. ALD11]|uniref:TlpA family protein disulfide reductase n=1 Tax=Polaribacter sp. ALD11 TaxID=2058137 RepID=UPI0018E27ED8|nr:TlpA disulfide reductase family protein [Polaribacter sp. ALD11]